MNSSTNILKYNTLKFKTRFIKAPDIDSGYFEIPSEIEAALGGRGRVKVHAWISGVYYRGSLVRMEKGGCLLLLVTKKVKAEAGIGFDEIVTVEVREDTDVREVDVPEDLKKILGQHSSLGVFFEKLSYTNRKEYANWINSARRPETREARLKKCIELLHAGKKNPTDK